MMRNLKLYPLLALLIVHISYGAYREIKLERNKLIYSRQHKITINNEVYEKTFHQNGLNKMIYSHPYKSYFDESGQLVAWEMLDQNNNIIERHDYLQKGGTLYIKQYDYDSDGNFEKKIIATRVSKEKVVEEVIFLNEHGEKIRSYLREINLELSLSQELSTDERQASRGQ